MRASFKSLPFGLLLIVCAGCAWPCGLPCCSCRPKAAAQLECREVQPQPITPDLSSLPPGPVPGRVNEQFCAITEIEAQCLAAKNSKTANLLVKEAEAAAAQKKCIDGGSELARDLLLLQASHQRNEDAAAALELYLRLVEAEGGAQNLGRRLQEVDAMHADVERLQARGLASPVSKNELETQRQELLHRQAEVQGNIDRLNHQLTELLGVELPPGKRFWPEADLWVDPDLADADEAVYFGLANRADLAALRMASQAEGRDAVVAARVLLQPLGVGSVSTGSSHLLAKLCHLCSGNPEADAREDQLRMAYREQQQTVEHEVRQANDLVATRLSQIAITRDRQTTIEARRVASQRRQEVIASPLSIRTINLDVLAAEQDLLHDTVEWKIAIVKLKQAQGLLAIECGYCK